MSDHAYAFSAAFRSYHVDAHVLPLPDEESISLGREAIGGQECCPCLFLVGDMLRYLKGNNRELNKSAFFMISGDGPCRLGQYPFLQRLILDKNGYEEVSILDASQDQSFYERLGIRSFDFKRLVLNTIKQYCCQWNLNTYYTIFPDYPYKPPLLWNFHINPRVLACKFLNALSINQLI